jgi:GNAT superfamily N-acetyltransferase
MTGNGRDRAPWSAVDLEFDYLTRRRSFDELVDLARNAYSGRPRSTATDPAMWRGFPRGYVGAWDRDRLVGCIQLWPLDGRRAGDFLIGARSEGALTVDDLATVCNGPSTVWFFSGLLVEPEWRGRGMAAHLFAEAMVRWHRDLPWRTPIQFVALATGDDVRGFIKGFGMHAVRPGNETADGHPIFARTLATEAELFDVVRSAREAADRKGRLVGSG